jgi:hypothetical protein
LFMLENQNPRMINEKGEGREATCTRWNSLGKTLQVKEKVQSFAPAKFDRWCQFQVFTTVSQHPCQVQWQPCNSWRKVQTQVLLQYLKHHTSTHPYW